MATEKKTIELPEDQDAKLALKRKYVTEGWTITGYDPNFLTVEREKPEPGSQTEGSTGGLRRGVKLTD
jgi:hypothetical protein